MQLRGFIVVGRPRARPYYVWSNYGREIRESERKSAMSLEGKTAIVTGSTSGIGLGIVRGSGRIGG